MNEFVGFPKIARWNRELVVTEKIDGTNAQILITEAGEVFAGSRSRWITPEADNHGFAKWVLANAPALALELGPGRHFGEWWGQGIQRRYGLTEKRFSLFNYERWKDAPLTLCRVVPLLWSGPLELFSVDKVLNDLRDHGSYAAPGFMDPEGIVIFHTAANICFKKTLKGDEGGKGA